MNTFIETLKLFFSRPLNCLLLFLFSCTMAICLLGGEFRALFFLPIILLYFLFHLPSSKEESDEEEPITIVVERRGSVWRAYLEHNPPIWEQHESRHAAIGLLTLRCQQELGLKIEPPEQDLGLDALIDPRYGLKRMGEKAESQES